MTELLAPFAVAPEVVEQPADIAEASPRTPVLITEQQVLFATAAALPVMVGRSCSSGEGNALASTSSSASRPSPVTAHTGTTG